MSKIKVILVAMNILMFTTAGFGHGGGHDHQPIDESKAISKAKEVVSKMVKKGKIKSSWKAAKSYVANKKTFSEGKEWLITVKNSAGTSGKKTLYIYLSLSGEYLAANFTGK